MAYSAVTHPRSESRIHRGTSSSMEAVHRTRVRPIEIRTDPGVESVKPSSTLIGRSWSGRRSVIEGTLNGPGQTAKPVPGTARLTASPKAFSAWLTDTDGSRYGGMWVSTRRPTPMLLAISPASPAVRWWG